MGFIGQVSHVLFGTVTEDELLQYRVAIEQLGKSMQDSVHFSNKLLSAVKHLQDRSVLVEEHLQQLRTAISSWIEQYRADRKKLSATFYSIFLQLKIDRALTSLEHLIRRFSDQTEQYNLQLESLESLKLSRKLFPVKEIAAIRDQGLTKGLLMPSDHWMYSYIRVQPLWTDQNHLIYKAEIPMFRQNEYLSYKLTSYPYPVSSNHAILFNLESDLALAVNSEFILKRANCQGKRPEICSGTGPLYDRSNFLCEQALIVGPSTNTISRCHFKTIDFNQSLVYENPAGRFVIASPGIEAKLSCPNSHEKIIKFSKGVFSVVIKAQCRLRGPNWLLMGKIAGKTNITIKFVPIQADLTSFIFKLPSVNWTKLASIPNWTPLEKIKDLALNPLDSPYLPFLNIKNQLPWTNLLLCLLLCCPVIFLCILLRRRIARQWPCCRKSIDSYLKNQIPASKSSGKLRASAPDSDFKEKQHTDIQKLDIYPDLNQLNEAETKNL